MESECENPQDKHPKYLTPKLGLQIARQLLLKVLENGSGSSNIVFSPLSFHTMLSLIACGSTGCTLDQLLSFLGSKSSNDLNSLSPRLITVFGSPSSINGETVDYTLSFVNSIWVDKRFPLKPSFEYIAKDIYKAEAKEIDFLTKTNLPDSPKQPEEATQEINSWAENATKGLIKDLIPLESADDKTALTLVNALYFKGAWDRKFDSSKTQTRHFHLLNGESIMVPFMTTNRYEKHLYRSTNEGFRILKVPYQSHSDARKFSMYFFLPDERDGLQNLIKRFNSNPELMNLPLFEEMLPDLWVPKFKFSYAFEASRILKELGLYLPFMMMGDFSEMIKPPYSEKLYLSKVFHKTYIEVNEEGTEAAASTAPRLILQCGVRCPPSFVADHPFIFLLKEETSESNLFMGYVVNPLTVSSDV